MKRKKNIAMALILTIFVITIASILSGCVNHLEDEVVIGDFVCQEWSDGTINLKDLSEEGKKKKNIVVPEKLNGRKVVMLGYRNAIFSSGTSDWHSENLENVYILGEKYKFFRNIFDNCPKVDKIILISSRPYAESSKFMEKGRILFENTNKYFSRDIESDLTEIPYLYAANLSYYYNYESAPNDGYYWIDDVEDGELIDFIPQDPERDGYKFQGWYKEQECINEWNFNEDKIQKAEYYAEFIENKLFAKWAKE